MAFMPLNMEYLKNFAGFKLPDDDMRNIVNPRFETLFHVQLKFAQAGSIAGYFGSRVYLGIQHLRKSTTPIKKGDNTAQQFLEKSCRASRNLMVAGFLVSTPIFILHGNSKKVDAEGYFDRAYRIRYNEGQCNVDRLSLAMGVFYGSIFAMTSRSFTLGFPKGLCWGTLLAAAYNNYAQASRLKQSMKEQQD